MGQVTMSIGGRDVGNGDFPQATFAVRVFSRDFVDENVFPTGGNVAPILVLGKQNVEKQKQVDELKLSLATAQGRLQSGRQENARSEATLDKFCIDQAKTIKDTLRSSSTSPYNNYNKADFTERARKMITAGDRQTHQLSDGSRETLLKQHCATPKETLQRLTYRLPVLKTLVGAASKVLSITVVSAAIESLKGDASLASWVHEGLGLHREHRAARCLFCDRPIPEDRLSALEAHFSTEYEEFLTSLNGQIDALRLALGSADELPMPNAAELYDDLASIYRTAASTLRSERDAAKRVLEALVAALEDKKSRPFEPVALDLAVPDLNATVVEDLNAIVLKHNQACDDFESRAGKAREQLEAGMVAAALEEFIGLGDAVRGAQGKTAAAVGEVKLIEAEIGKLEREIVEHRQPAEELNNDLRSYLGHGELRLDIKDTGYAIVRHEAPAEALSEGERTAIALLYFLKSLRDRRFDLEKGLVVLDDPVSSLDSNALYSAFGFIQERTRDAGQLIVLTHNFTFFRQVRNWFHRLKGQRKPNVAERPARFYMLDCTHESGRRCAHIRPLDRLLEEFESEYHYLFAYVYRAAAAPARPLEQNYVLPNLARRLLEAFLAFRQPQRSGELWQKLQVLEFSEAKKIRILRFLHTFSHDSAIGGPEHDLSLLGEAQAVLKDLLELMESQDKEHFSAMVSLVTPPGAGSEEEGR